MARSPRLHDGAQAPSRRPLVERACSAAPRCFRTYFIFPGGSARCRRCTIFEPTRYLWRALLASTAGFRPLHAGLFVERVCSAARRCFKPTSFSPTARRAAAASQFSNRRDIFVPRSPRLHGRLQAPQRLCSWSTRSRPPAPCCFGPTRLPCRAASRCTCLRNGSSAGRSRGLCASALGPRASGRRRRAAFDRRACRRRCRRPCHRLCPRPRQYPCRAPHRLRTRRHVPASPPTPAPTYRPSPAPSPVPTLQPTRARCSRRFLRLCRLQSRQPTLLPSPAPTRASRPTPLPSLLPSCDSTPQPSPAPTPLSSPLPTYAPSPQPNHVPTPLRSPLPTHAPWPKPSPVPTPPSCPYLRMLRRRSLAPSRRRQALLCLRTLRRRNLATSRRHCTRLCLRTLRRRSLAPPRRRCGTAFAFAYVRSVAAA
jgi:hypothetical protein